MCVLAVPLTQGFSPSLSLRGPSSSLSWVSGEYSGEWCPGSAALREGPVCEVRHRTEVVDLPASGPERGRVRCVPSQLRAASALLPQLHSFSLACGQDRAVEAG